MARPKEITLEQGTVSLLGFPPEVSTALAEHIKSFGKPTEASALSGGPLPDVALSIRLDKKNNKMQVVTLNYNVDTKEAKIATVIDADGLRDASTKFKLAAVELNFV